MDKLQKQIAAFLRGLTTGASDASFGQHRTGGPHRVARLCVLVGKGDYKPLYTGLATADAQRMTESLSSQNIDSQISSDGTTVLVRADQLDKARLGVASQDRSPADEWVLSCSTSRTGPAAISLKR